MPDYSQNVGSGTVAITGVASYPRKLYFEEAGTGYRNFEEAE